MNGRAIVSVFQVGNDLLYSPFQRHKGKIFVSAISFHWAKISDGDTEIGRLAIQTLDESSTLPIVPDVDPKQRDKQWEAAMASEIRVPSYRDAYQKSILVSLYRYEDGDVDIAPSIHDSGHFLTKAKEVTTLSRPSAEALGAAIKMAMQRSE